MNPATRAHQDLVDAAARSLPRYHPEAFTFLNGVIADVHRAVGGKDPNAPPVDILRHLVEVAVHAWGLLAGVVLRHWGIRTTLDVGHVCYALIAARAYRAHPGEHLEDFNGGDVAAAAEDLARDHAAGVCRTWARAS